MVDQKPPMQGPPVPWGPVPSPRQLQLPTATLPTPGGVTGKITDKAPWEPGPTSNHAPPPGTRWQYTSVSSWYGVPTMYGNTYTNRACDDGSAETRVVDSRKVWDSDEWVKVPLDGRYAIFPSGR